MGPDVMFIFFVLLLLLLFFFWGGGGGEEDGVCWGKVGGRGADIHSNSEVSGTRENRELKVDVYGKRQTSSWESLKIGNEQIKTAQKIHMDKKIAWNY